MPTNSRVYLSWKKNGLQKYEYEVCDSKINYKHLS